MLFEKGSELVPCVNAGAHRAEGLRRRWPTIEKQWLSDVVDVPELQ